MSQPPQPPYPGQPYPEEPSEGQPHRPWSGQPNPDVPTSVPPQPGYPAYGQQASYPAQGDQPPPYGQPSYGQPSYGQPPYGQPSYHQSQYGQPSYDQSRYGGAQYSQPQSGGAQYEPRSGQPDLTLASVFPPQQPPKKKSKALPIVLISVATFLVLCVGGGTAIYLGIRNTAHKVNTALNSPDPTPTGSAPGRPTDGPTRPPAATITVVEPKTLGGRRKLNDAQFASLAKELKSGMAEVPDATNSVGALYGTVAKRNIVVVAAAAAPIDDPVKELDSTFNSGGLKVTGITAVSPGTLGGRAQCGKSREGDVNLAICAWADNGSVGMLIFFFESVSKAKAEFPKLRAQVEKKSS